ncbi:hypothetical protein HMPREF3100_03880 [Enterococcus sp. HMSC29A04]|nr:hypothetical protein HMPREF3001_07150 [Enterococcus sp. HMSC066C04]OFT89073.1 hypothetical protein HMPREF3100_03880 [Enterococcus sp. HMSC29A04]OFU59740.1 hypothetical protein HMPREF3128_17665 [Enterococcus sp. HMSC14A10]GMS54592.1 hypothetical protein NUITMVRE36_15830 [Enterococcus raffinosus]
MNISYPVRQTNSKWIAVKIISIDVPKTTASYGKFTCFLEKNNFDCFYLKDSIFLGKMNLFDCYSL